MEKSTSKQVGRPSFRTLVYYVLIGLMFGGCAMQPATSEDIAELDQTHSPLRSEVTTTNVPTQVGVVANAPPLLTLPTTPLPNGIADQCRCAWGTWSSGSGLTCVGIRCNEFCTMATRGCVERQACVPTGI